MSDAMTIADGTLEHVRQPVTIPVKVLDIGIDVRPALALIDLALSSSAHRNLVSTDELTNWLLDIRSSLTPTEKVTPTGVRP